MALTPVAAARAGRLDTTGGDQEPAPPEMRLSRAFWPQLRIVVLIPTRNRAALAIAAMDSVLAAPLREVEVVVSDNSTDELEITQLEAACVARGVRRIRPAEPLAMAAHWDWALREILKDRYVSHIGVLTDRMIFQAGALLAAAKVVAKYPDSIITYNHDGLDDDSEPVTLAQIPWTGRVVAVPSVVLAELAARSVHEVLEPVLPRLLNSIVRRSAFESIALRFGSICADAIAPDYAFAYRCVAITPGIVHLDRPVLLSYAADRSNGTSAMRGRVTRDHADFLSNIDDRGLSFAAPLPGLPSAMNATVHEYCLVREKIPKLPAIDPAGYRALLATEATGMDPGPLRDELESAIATLPGPVTETPPRPSTLIEKVAHAIRSPRWAIDRIRARRSPDQGYRLTEWPDRRSAIAAAKAMPRPSRRGRSNLERTDPRIRPAQPVGR